MAFYGFSGDAGECYSTPYTYNYDDDDYYEYNPSHHSHRKFENPEENNSPFTENHLSGFWERDDYSDNDLFASTLQINQPKSLHYEPASYITSYISYNTKPHKVSFSTQEFIVPEFEEYDPTPYDGGYDATQVYGKALPPSDAICYPLPKQLSAEDGDFPPENFSYAAIPSPYGKPSDSPEPRCENKERPTKEEEKGEVEEDDEVPEKQMVMGEQHQIIPYGYGLEAVDICECLFGHWPCLDKMNYQERCVKFQEDFQRECCSNNHDPWKSTVDYIFGWPYGYGEHNNGGGYGDCYVNSYFLHE